jgi:hypothetical protein
MRRRFDCIRVPNRGVFSACAELRWGINFAHQGATIFATWFNYDVDGSPLWLSATLIRAGPEQYQGTLARTTGPPFNAVPFLPTNVHAVAVSGMQVIFANGNSATFRYTMNEISQTKQITRQVFRAPGTACQ